MSIEPRPAITASVSPADSVSPPVAVRPVSCTAPSTCIEPGVVIDSVPPPGKVAVPSVSARTKTDGVLAEPSAGATIAILLAKIRASSAADRLYEPARSPPPI